MKDDLNRALKVLQEGGLILYPTDTIWGIGCDATNEKAVRRIYNLKKREDSKSMLLLLHTENMLPSYVDVVPEGAWELIEATTEPLTIIYPGAKNIAKNLISEDQSIGIRITEDDFCTALLSRFRKPIVSTSANISGEASPANFLEIDEAILEDVDYVVKWRQEELGKSRPSSIIKLGVGGEIKILR
ncbi:MAG: L-threonylcarbamoyladenylate synthase [Bacteroidales bacterium]|jgi:L-threonylcarbamoyladenylate synthase|nr:L-threonylcarbamoyladenylate synthase [Bacteroidales bacterium]